MRQKNDSIYASTLDRIVVNLLNPINIINLKKRLMDFKRFKTNDIIKEFYKIMLNFNLKKYVDPKAKYIIVLQKNYKIINI